MSSHYSFRARASPADCSDDRISPGGVLKRHRRASAVLAQQLGHAEGQIEALAGVQAGIAHGLVALAQVVVEDLLGAAEALGDVLPGQLHVDAAGPGPLGPVGPEEPGDLAQDVVEVTGLAAP